ncbi:hypothetical protein G3I55_22960 [Streptomyces sp. SID6648]|nr:hypothetical protein [Streptomyces sp. SID6648]
MCTSGWQLPGCRASDHGDDTVIGILAISLAHHATDPALIPTNLNRLPGAAPWLAQAG